MKVNQTYVNLPVKDVQRTRAFWSKLGFTINEQFSDDKAVCVIIKEEHIYAMFLDQDYFQTFSGKPVPQGDTSEVLLAMGLDSREEVDRIVNTALENGATQHEEPQDYGWMYQNSFWDLDGHGWNMTFADLSQIPSE